MMKKFHPENSSKYMMKFSLFDLLLLTNWNCNIFLFCEKIDDQFTDNNKNMTVGEVYLYLHNPQGRDNLIREENHHIQKVAANHNTVHAHHLKHAINK